MKNGKKILLQLTAGAMEICWIYALSAFLINIFFQREYLFHWAAAAFISGALVAGFLLGTGWRVIYKLLINISVYCIIVLIVIYACYYHHDAFFSRIWITDFFTASRTFIDWLDVLVLFTFILLLFISGTATVKREKSYFKLCTRFDIGLAAFFCVFLGKFVLMIKIVETTDNILTFVLLFPFLFFGLVSVAISGKETNAHKDFLPGYSMVGLLTGFSAVILLCAACILLLMPVLTMAADMSYKVVKNGSGFLPLLLNLLRIIITPGTVRELPEAGSVNFPLGNVTQSKWAGLIETIVSYGIMGAVFFVLVLVIGILLLFAIKWLLLKIIQLIKKLFSRDTLEPENLRQLKKVFNLLIIFWNIVKYLYNFIIRRFQKYKNAADLYKMLILWGSQSGVMHPESETALEYGTKLSRYFPGFKTEIDNIILFFNMETYGEINSAEEFLKAKIGLRTLRKPRYLPLRLKIYIKYLTSGLDMK